MTEINETKPTFVKPQLNKAQKKVLPSLMAIYVTSDLMQQAYPDEDPSGELQELLSIAGNKFMQEANPEDIKGVSLDPKTILEVIATALAEYADVPVPGQLTLCNNQA